MGFDTTAVTWIWVVGGITMGGAVITTSFTMLDDLVEARAAQEDREALELGTSLTTANATYDAATNTYLFYAQNSGTSVVDVDDVTVLLDGVARPAARAQVLGESGDQWMPGDRAEFVVEDVDERPTRVLLAAAPAPAFPFIEDTAGVDGTVRFVAGYGATDAHYVKKFHISDDGLEFGGVFKPKNGAGTNLSDVVRVMNTRATSANVTLIGEPVSNPQVKNFTWIVRSGSTIVGHVDYGMADPRATFNVAAGASDPLDVQLKFKDGSGKNNAAFPFRIRLEVSS